MIEVLQKYGLDQVDLRLIQAVVLGGKELMFRIDKASTSKAENVISDRKVNIRLRLWILYGRPPKHGPFREM